MTSYHPETETNPRTRSSYKPWYNSERPNHSPIIPIDALIPISISNTNMNSTPLFQLVRSQNAIPERQQCLPIEQVIDKSFYSTWLPDIHDLPLHDIALAAKKHNLYKTCTSNYDHTVNCASSTWHFASMMNDLYSRTSKTMTECSKYRAALISIMISLKILLLSETYLGVASGRALLSCDHKKARKDAFSQSLPGIRRMIQNDSNILAEIDRLRAQITSPIDHQFGLGYSEAVVPALNEEDPPAQTCLQFINHPLETPSIVKHFSTSRKLTVMLDGNS